MSLAQYFSCKMAVYSHVLFSPTLLQLVSQVGGFPLLPLSALLGSNLGVRRFLAPLFAGPPLSKHLGKVESFLWPVPACRVAMETSLLCLILARGPQEPFMEPVPKLIYWL